MKDFLKIISEKLSSDIDCAAMPGDYASYALEKDNFFEIIKMPSQCKAAFVDGGSCIIIDSPSLCVGFIRVCACVMQGSKTMSIRNEEYFSIAYAKDGIVHEACIVDKNGSTIGVPITEESIANGERLRLSKMIDSLRRNQEIAFAKKIMDNLDLGDIIVMDGNLKATTGHEKQNLHELYDSAVDKEILLIAVAKTNNSVTKTGDCVLAQLARLAPSGAWFYFPAFVSNTMKHHADTYFARLQRNSEYILTIDVLKSQSENFDRAKIMSLLSFYSSDIAFPGYPYGLVKADMLARVSNKEKELLLTRLSTTDPGLFKKLKPYIKSLDAHSVLDSM